MTHLLEPVAVAMPNQAQEEECPFNMPDVKGAAKVDPENIKDDDKKRAQSRQENNGGTLGENLTNASPGKKGTIEGPFPPDTPQKRPAYDAKRKDGKNFRWVVVMGAADIPEGRFPLLVAAHHLIPGNASLKPSKIMSFMKKGGSIKSKAGKTYKIKDHIGYNVNGAHNGIWLPGNYAIRRAGAAWQKVPKKGKSWSGLADHPWCECYVAAVVKATGGQFHDAHTQYSAHVKNQLNTLAAALSFHIDFCDPCKSKQKKGLPPPFIIKLQLYNYSRQLWNQLCGAPTSWKRPYFASDRWRDKVFRGSRISPIFKMAYNHARAVHSPNPRE